jgi:hypothetical protein
MAMVVGLAALSAGCARQSGSAAVHPAGGSRWRFPGRWSRGAIVAVHGSWDRQPPRAPAVLWLPWEAKTKTLGVSDDQAGAIYRIVP